MTAPPPWDFQCRTKVLSSIFLHVKNVRNLDIFLDNGDSIPLSQKKQRAWKQELTNYLSGAASNGRGGKWNDKASDCKYFIFSAGYCLADVVFLVSCLIDAGK